MRKLGIDKKTGKEKHQVDVYMPDGIRLRPTFIGTKAEAYEYEADLQRNAGKVNLGSMTIGEIAGKYLPWVKNNQAETTYTGKKKALFGHILPHFRTLKPYQITSEEIENYKTHRYEETLKTRKINRAVQLELVYLHGMIMWAADPQRRYCEAPIKWSMPKYKRPVPSVWTVEEMQRLFAQFSIFHKALFGCLYCGQLRRNEAVTLRLCDIQIDSAEITVRGKGDKVRIVAIPPVLVNFLKDHVALLKKVDDEQTDHEKKISPKSLLFPSPVTGKQLKELKCVLRLAQKRAKIDKRLHPHLFRHCGATHMLEAGQDIRIIQEQLGHADISTTQWYTHVVKETRKKAVDDTFEDFVVNNGQYGQ